MNKLSFRNWIYIILFSGFLSFFTASFTWYILPLRSRTMCRMYESFFLYYFFDIILFSVGFLFFIHPKKEAHHQEKNDRRKCDSHDCGENIGGEANGNKR